jgi:transglutaminase-like putative cysteine protease
LDRDTSYDQQAATTIGTEIAALDVLDHDNVDWARVHRTAFLIHQHLRYDYPGPIEDLNHRLMIVPPDRHLDQRRVVHRVEISSDAATVTTRYDSFDNLVLEVHVPYVERAISFEAWIVVERRLDLEPREDVEVLRDGRLLQATHRTQPDDRMRAVAGDLMFEGHRGMELARRINAWVYDHLRYVYDVTDIHTTASEALALGQGVCQDYAHVMLALCRLCGIPARYISGHLLGEGGTHAWVEILLPSERSDHVHTYPFDPTHGREAGLSYVTVAVGRDYGDVAPTSGSFLASYRGRLFSHKHVGLTAVDYQPEG